MFTNEELIAAATALWGPQNRRLSKKNDLRFGTNGSKHLKLPNGGWFDHEAEEGGDAVELMRRAGHLKERRPNGHGNGSTRHDPFARVHDYKDEHGTLVFQTLKKHDGQWTQRRPTGPGTWAWDLRGVRRVLYRLPALVRADVRDPVFITEGEKDADNVGAIGVISTTNPGGAGKWRPEYSEFLRGREVVILPDNDDAGHRHASAVVAALSGIAGSVLVITLPGLATKNDVSDWIAAGGTREELMELVRGARGETPAWLALCQYSDAKEPKPIPNLVNAYTAISNSPLYRRYITYDQMECAALLHRKALTDANVIATRKWIQNSGIKRMAGQDVQDAFTLYAHEHAFHPVRQYLNSLRWDNSPRVDTWLTAYLGVESNPYSQEVGKRFLISMVARIFEPGCQCDYMIVLEGEQGELKSSCLRALAEPWFDDNLPDVSNKDSSQYLRGKWLIEIKEMHAFSKAETTDIKKFLDRRHERYFARYGRNECHEPRQCVFAGTTNKDTYLKDETGNRRTWPLATGTIRLDSLKRDRDQIFAEAVHLYRNKEPWWPDRAFEREFIKPEQDKRFDPDIWTEKITTWLSSTMLTTVTVRQIALEAIEMKDKDQDGRAEKRIISVLKTEGWTRQHTRKGGVWRRPVAVTV